MRTYTNKEAVEVLGWTVRTFQRWRKAFRVSPVDWTGTIPLFTRRQLQQIKARHDAHLERNRKARR